MASTQIELTAGFAYTQNDGEVAMVGFAGGQYDTKACLLLQRTLCPSCDDIERGWDDVHIMADDHTRAAYGGIKRITLRHPKQVLIEVSPATANNLGTAESISVNIAGAETDERELAEMLRLVCGEYAQFDRSSA